MSTSLLNGVVGDYRSDSVWFATACH